MIICVGEILADMIGRNSAGQVTYECLAGGAPFNVACCLGKLLRQCGFCGNVGCDSIGDHLMDIARAQDFDELILRRDKERNTTLAFVSIDDSGERRFSFYRKNTADAYFDAKCAADITDKADIVHIGSLMLSLECGRSFAKELIALAHAIGKKVSFDVNYREDIFSSAKEAASVYSEYIRLADIVKLSEEEIRMFSDAEGCENMLIDIAGNEKTVFLTLGGRGSMACYQGKIYIQPNIHVSRVVDTNGAGDSFMAGALAAIDEGEEDMQEILRRANVCGALAVSQKGAYPVWSFGDAKELYNRAYT